MNFKALVLLGLICFTSSSLVKGAAHERLAKMKDETEKQISPRDCASQYHDMMFRYTDQVVHYISWYMQNYGYDPKTMPDAANTISAQDPNSVTWSGSFTTYNANMYDHSKFDTDWRMGLTCSGDFLEVEVVMNVPQIKIRSHFELDIAKSNHHGFIDSKVDDYSFHIKYTVSYSDMTVYDFRLSQENMSQFSSDTNYYDPVISWTFSSIESILGTTFSTVYNNEYQHIVTNALYSAFNSLKIIA
ncbi:uncharacterized protein LOC124160912 [Ischnura elegans]|uniref:uncharacterized protein LOC124160912 n=1 Tax=Ischnura elegans TaxID=197161 RepID=UPI001ED892FD|nr:uncharacterized protein LOC124160912 [Ischnura elegans]